MRSSCSVTGPKKTLENEVHDKRNVFLTDADTHPFIETKEH